VGAENARLENGVLHFTGKCSPAFSAPPVKLISVRRMNNELHFKFICAKKQHKMVNKRTQKNTDVVEIKCEKNIEHRPTDIF